MTNDFPEWKPELPVFRHEIIDTPLKQVVDFYLEHLKRDTQAGKLMPCNFWLVCHGFLLAARQSYASVCLLLSAKRPKPFMLQAGIINRSMFEILVNISALFEEPTRIEILNLEAFKSLALRYLDLRDQHSTEDKWGDYLEIFRRNLVSFAEMVGLSADAITDPKQISAEWPTPGILIFGSPRRKVAAWVTGNRQEMLKKLYAQYYPHQSELTHQRIAAVSAAMLVDNPNAQWNPGHGESSLVLTVAFLLACILAELQSAAGFGSHPKLTELWAYLREMDDNVTDLWELRYKDLVSPEGA